jgi:hypothetical protein
MRFLLVLLTLVSFRSFAESSANCELVGGIYVNSQPVIEEMNFETIVDVFTISNASALNFILDGKRVRLLRSEMSVNKVTKMTYMVKKNGRPVRAVRLMIDRTPKEVSMAREFYGNMIISPEMNDDSDFTKIQNSQNLVYNFYCQF